MHFDLLLMTSSIRVIAIAVCSLYWQYLLVILGCVCVMSGFHDKEEIFLFFVLPNFLMLGATHFPHGRGKNELIFLYREDFNFLCEE